MEAISDSVTYIFLFIALYFEVFILITYFESRQKTNSRVMKVLSKFPSVTVMVPCWNEERTVLKTVFSLLKLDYPKDKLSIFIIDDGSTDKTWNVIQRFKNHKQVRIFSKENGGKHTALNHGLSFAESELVGCLDADSFVDPTALKRMVSHFDNKEIMAVTPSIKVFEPRGILGLIQKAEYLFGIFIRKTFAHINAQYIVPGPFSLIRREVFEKLGPYRSAHKTEDLELALRMQKNRFKIENVHDAYVYTTPPNNFMKLYKQRLRWTYGFIKNTLDYKEMFLSPKYGHLGMAVLPAAGFSLFSTVYFFVYMLYEQIRSVTEWVVEFTTVGFYWKGFDFDFFFVDANLIVFVSLVSLAGLLLMLISSRKMAEEKTRFGKDTVLFMLLYMFIAPLWISRAFFNVVFAKKTDWR